MKYILFLDEQIDVLWLEIDGPNPTGERNIGLDREQQYTLDAGKEESTSCQPHIWFRFGSFGTQPKSLRL